MSRRARLSSAEGMRRAVEIGRLAAKVTRFWFVNGTATRVLGHIAMVLVIRMLLFIIMSIGPLFTAF